MPSEGWQPTEWTPPPSPVEREEAVRRAEAVARAARLWAAAVADLNNVLREATVQMEAFSKRLALLKGLDNLGVLAPDDPIWKPEED